MMKTVLSMLLLGVMLMNPSLADVGEEDGHDHDHDHDEDHGDHEGWPDCSCIVGGMECDNADAVTDAMLTLREKDCAEDCSSAVCKKAFFMLDMHHSGCPTGQLETTVGVSFHQYEDACQRCYQEPPLVDGAPDCDLSICDNPNQVSAAVVALNSQPCLSEGSSNSGCKDYFTTLLTYHDHCNNVTEKVVLNNFHDLEEDYEGVHCNLIDDHDHQIDCNSAINQEFMG